MEINCTNVDIFKICVSRDASNIDDNITLSGFASSNYPVNITFPSTFEKRKITEIGVYSFSETRLKNVVLGRYVIYIRESAFRHCIELESIVIPPSVRYIGEGGIRKANTKGQVNDSSLFVFFQPDSQLQYLDDDSISGATSITVIYCGCKAPKFVSKSVFYQVTDLMIITPVSMKFDDVRSISKPEKCYVHPVYKKYQCKCIISFHSKKNCINFMLILINFISK